MNGDIDTLVSMSHKGIDVTTACDGVSMYNDLHVFANAGLEEAMVRQNTSNM